MLHSFRVANGMQNSGSLPKSNSLRTPQQSLRRLNFCSQVATGQQTSPVVYPEKRTKNKASRRNDVSASSDDSKKAKREEHRIDIGDEQSDLLGYEVISGKLVLDKRKNIKANDAENTTENAHLDTVDAKLTSRVLVWGSHVLSLDDVVSVSFLNKAENGNKMQCSDHFLPVFRMHFFTWLKSTFHVFGKR